MSKEIVGIEYPLSRIFSAEFDYVIPSYQRPYVWTSNQAVEFFSDIYEFYSSGQEGNYFLGGMVLVKEAGKPHAEVIDGQQRLTTLTILLAAMTHHAKGASRDEYFKYLCEPGNPRRGVEPKPRLMLRERDRYFFQNFIQNFALDKLFALDPEKLVNRPQRRILANAWIFVELLNGRTEGDAQALDDFGNFLLQRCSMLVDEVARRPDSIDTSPIDADE